MAIRSSGTATFWRQYRELPGSIKRLARFAYQQFLRDPCHPSFHRKKPRVLEHHSPPIWEFRVTRQYRALCQVEGEEYVWIFIGDHVGFDREVRRLAP